MSTNKTVGVVGAPFNYGQPKKGVEKGPKSLRDGKALEALEALGWSVTDYGDLPIDIASPDVKHDDSKSAINVNEIAWGNEIIKNKVLESSLGNNVTLVFGGDHSVAIGYV